jgi:hypothetical protein
VTGLKISLLVGRPCIAGWGGHWAHQDSLFVLPLTLTWIVPSSYKMRLLDWSIKDAACITSKNDK